MDDIEKKKEDALKFLRSIKTVDDLKTHQDEVFAIIEEFLKAGVKALHGLFESMFSLSDVDMEDMLSKIQDENFLLGEEFGEEIERIGNIPVSDEDAEEFSDELEARMKPYLEESSEKMAEIMEKITGTMVEGMTAGFEEIFGGPGGDEDDDADEILPEPHESREDLGHLDRIYDLFTLDHFKENRDYLIEDMEKLLQDDLMYLNIKLENEWPKEEVQEDLDKAERHITVYISEIERQFKRLGEIPGAAEYAEESVKMLKERTEPHVENIRKFEKKVKK